MIRQRGSIHVRRSARIYDVRIAQFALKIEKLIVRGSQDLLPIYTQHRLPIHARQKKKRERRKRGVGWRGIGRLGKGVLRGEAGRNTPLDAIMVSRCHGDDTFVAFQPMRFFCFWRNGEFISKNVYSPSIFLGPHPLPSQGFRFALASSSLAIISARSTIE